MTDMQQVQLHNHQMIYDPQSFAKIEPQMFSRNYWNEQNCILGESIGRGVTVFFKHQEREFVLRHYLRGGLIARLISNQYFNTGYQHSRAWLEFKLLEHLIRLKLPVPKPAAALVSRSGLFYTADIILHKIANASDTHHYLTRRNLTSVEWQTIGQTIALFHNNQVFHHDLNIHNIMLDKDGKAWLIDFDKCKIKSGDAWKAKNLARLKRSLDKEQARESQYFFNHSGWQQLTAAYDETIQ
jgi:3-deoxy-D-manno-octulosonic acid kinase